MRRFFLCSVLLVSLAALSTINSEAQSNITTFAGLDFPKVGATALTQPIDGPYAITSDAAGGFYIASFPQNRVYHIDVSGYVDKVAGTSYGFSGDGGLASAAQFRGAFGVAVDTNGNYYVADTNNHRIRKISPLGIVQTVAGNGKPGFSGDGDVATSAQLQFPSGIALDRTGNLYIADRGNNRVRKLGTDGLISTIAGNGVSGSAGDGGFATAAQLNQPTGIVVDRLGGVIVSEFAGHRIRRISGDLISTLAGNGIPGYSGDGGIGISAQLNRPAGLAVDSVNNLYVADSGNHRIRIVAISSTVVGLVAGTGVPGFSGDMGPAFQAELNSPMGVGLDGLDNLYIADTGNNRIRTISGSVITTAFGNGTGGFDGDNGLAISAQLNSVRGMVADSSGTVYIADTGNNRIRRVGADGFITTFAGLGAQGLSGDGGGATLAQLNRPYGLAIDATGALLIADTFNNRIRKVDSMGIITNFAGYGSGGYGGDGDLAIYALFNQPRAVAADRTGNVYIADTLNNRVCQITLDGKLRTLAGNGTAGDTGDGGPAYAATLNTPSGLAIDKAGNLFIADTGNRRIRKIDTNGIITTVAGTSGPGISGINGDGLGATASTAVLSRPTGVAVDSNGTIFISEPETGRIRAVSSDRIIRTVAGNGVSGYSGDGRSATDAQVNDAESLMVDANGTLYIADTGNHRVRRVTNPAPVIGYPLVISGRGGLSFGTPGGALSATVGYGRIQTTDPTFAGLSIFSYRQNGVLVSEAAVPATRAISAGRIYAYVGNEVVGGRTPTFVDTGLAIANPNDVAAEVSFSFTGSTTGSVSTTIGPHAQIAAFLDQSPFNAGRAFDGTLTFNSTVPVAVTALRGLTNQRGEFLVTTLPVAELGPTAGPVFIPHFADGGGWVTQINLINPTEASITGTVQFLDQSGIPMTVTANGVTDTNFSYSMRAREAFRLTTSGLTPSVRVGSVRVIPSGSDSAPTGMAIFSFQQNGITVTEAGVRSMKSGTAFHMYVEAAGDFAAGATGAIQSGIAIANLSGSAVTVTITIDRLDGSSTGLTGAVTVPANGQIATFLNQVPGFTGLSLPFQGVLRATSTAPIAIVGLRGRYNERSEFLITTTSATDEGAAPPYAELFFPHIVDSGGYTTQFILLAGASGQVTGSLTLFSQSGQLLSLTLR